MKVRQLRQIIREEIQYISASIDLPVKGDKDIETRGLFTSLTFLGQAHHE